MCIRDRVVQSRDDLQAHKLPYAHYHPPLADLAAAVEELRPTALIGVSGQPRTFTPVSYTHLDVYKRQDVICRVRANDLPAAMAELHRLGQDAPALLPDLIEPWMFCLLYTSRCV